MTKRPDVNPDGYVEFWNDSKKYLDNECEATFAKTVMEHERDLLSTSDEHKTLKTVAIGRIYLTPKTQDHE